ncbi:MAG: hypothetical protein SOZ28_08465 [Clostridia bacterium]|nr:hypothetical protein [Clostridia bacterium]
MYNDYGGLYPCNTYCPREPETGKNYKVDGNMTFEEWKNGLTDEQRASLKYIDKSAENGIIKAEPFSTRFVNSSEGLFKNSGKIKPIEGYEDIVIHGDKTGFAYHDKNGNEMHYTVREFADILKNSNVYNGGNVRLISCETGADGATAAQSLAEQLNVTVMASSNTVWVMPDGAMSIDDTSSINNGEWRIFKPKRK